MDPEESQRLQYIPHIRAKRTSLTENILWPAIFVFIAFYGLAVLRGGYLHYEGQFFLSNYLDGRGIFDKIFSSHFNEWDCYQGRELSFLFGLLDAQAIALGSRFGVPFLYSLTSVTAVLATAILLWKLIPRIATRLSVTEGGLIVSLMLSTPALALSHYYYRPAKALVGLFLVLITGQILRLASGSGSRPVFPAAALLFVFATLMGMSDRQGVFLIVVAIAIVAGLADLSARSVRVALSALLAALAASAVWSVSLGPRLSEMADRFAPDTFNQHVALRTTFANPRNYASALMLWREDIGFFFGSWGAPSGIVVLILIGLTYWMHPGEDKREKFLRRHRLFVVLVLASGMLLALYTAMYAKLPSITWPESRLVYYWIPEMVIIAIVAAVACDSAFGISDKFRAPVSLLLGMMICTSLVALPGHEGVVRNGEQRVVIGESSRVRECLVNPALPITRYHLTAAGAHACSMVRLAAFGSAGPGRSIGPAVPNPLLYCRRTGRR